MSEFTALIVTRRTDGVPRTYTLTHEIENRVSMFEWILEHYTSKREQVETITILSEEN
jgi:hypothetical protein